LNKKRKKSLKATVIYFLVLLLVSLLAYGYKSLERFFQEGMASFELSNVVIEGNSFLSRRDVLRLCGLKEKERLLTVSPKKVAENILKSPYVKSVSAVRSLPATLRISITERKAVAFIYGRGLNLIDDEGVLLPVPKTNRRMDYPFISHADVPIGKLGERTTLRSVRRAVQVINYINVLKSSLGDLVAEVSVRGRDEVELRLINGGGLVKIRYGQYQDKLFMLSEYVQRYQNWNDLANIEYIDLRFDKQLIVKEKKS
jgi:cell division septal protein FtsQ